MVVPIMNRAKEFGVNISPNLIVATRNYPSLAQLKATLRKAGDLPIPRILLTGGSAPQLGTIELGDAIKAVRDEKIEAGIVLSPLWWDEPQMMEYLARNSPDFVVTELVLDLQMLKKVLVTTRDIDTAIALPFADNGTFLIRGGPSGLVHAMSGKTVMWPGLNVPIGWDETKGAEIVPGARFPHNACLLPDNIVVDGQLNEQALMVAIVALERELQKVSGRKYPLLSWLRVARAMNYASTLNRLTILGAKEEKAA
jgi:hypothetical protein